MCIRSYTRLTVSLITIILTIFISSGINLAYKNLPKNIIAQESIYEQKPIEEKSKKTDKEEDIEKKLSKDYNLEEQIWEIEIPKISLLAPIAEGTTQEVMRKYVGHFENTSFWKGNIGLAAHNRGFLINYFEKVKDLKIGDEIIYRTPEGEKIYEVNFYRIIEDTDWSYLQKTEDNRITLITCVSNKPNKRLCVQAKEKDNFWE